MTVDWEFFVPLPGSGMDFSDFVPWSMGCNYIFTIGSPSYNVQRMLTICFNTSSAGRYCPMVTGYRVSRYLLISSSPDLEHEAQSRPEHLWKDILTGTISPELEREREQWMVWLSRPGLGWLVRREGEGEQIQWWENDERRGNQSQRGEDH